MSRLKRHENPGESVWSNPANDVLRLQFCVSWSICGGLQREPRRSCLSKFFSRSKAGFMRVAEVVNVYLGYMSVQECLQIWLVFYLVTSSMNFNVLFP